MANKSFGQHFLKNRAVIQKIVNAIAPEEGTVLFEIGPGNGELTIPLLEKYSGVHGKMIVIEKDEKLADALAATEPGKNIDIVKGDVLELLPTLVPEKEYKLAGNIPYYITGHLLRVISELPRKPLRSVFMVQREVAERLIAQPPKMNRLAASVQFWADPKVLVHVPKEDFIPMPKVDSAVIVLERKSSGPIDAEHYYATVRTLFAQPRKTILNNLAVFGTKEEIAATLRGIGIDPLLRPQNLSIENILAIAGALSGKRRA